MKNLNKIEIFILLFATLATIIFILSKAENKKENEANKKICSHSENSNDITNVEKIKDDEEKESDLTDIKKQEKDDDDLTNTKEQEEEKDDLVNIYEKEEEEIIPYYENVKKDENKQQESNVKKVEKKITEEKKIEPIKKELNSPQKLNVISSFTTKMTLENEKEENRLFNIKTAISYINGKIIKPDETFSYNTNIWANGKGKKYKVAQTLSQNGMDRGRGGGVCQVSSTLFVAALKANLKIVERYNHSRKVSYAPLGLDATYVTGVKDLKIKNPYKYPIKIEASYTNDHITINLVDVENKIEIPDVKINSAEILETTKLSTTSEKIKTRVAIEKTINGNKTTDYINSEYIIPSTK